MLAAVAILLLPAADPSPEPPPAAPKPPVVKFVKASVEGGSTHLTFEVINPNRSPLPYAGYTPESFSGGLKGGVIAPIYRIEVNDGKAWKSHFLGWCGTGIGPVSIPAKGKGTFEVSMPGDWAAIKVGLTWYKTAERKEVEVTWSEPLTRKAATPAPGKKP
jgi:hypothetical protein